jgi:hypothetical protein
LPKTLDPGDGLVFAGSPPSTINGDSISHAIQYLPKQCERDSLRGIAGKNEQEIVTQVQVGIVLVQMATK